MHTLRAAFAAVVVLVASTPMFAQTTAGSATVIVVPVTAQTASFTSEITVYNPNGVAVTVDVAFYEANNSTNPGLRTCIDVAVPAGKTIQFTLSLQCALGAGSHFGLLVLSDVAGTNTIYGYVRTQNPQGIGFSTEGFPAVNFNNQVSHSTGLKKTTAGLIYQTNCFAGSLAQAVTYTLKLFDGTSNAQIGSTITGNLAAFQQIRYLDIFSAPPNGVGAPAGNQLNVRAEFASTNSAVLVGFCTVQDNTSFGADFRIAKSYGTTAAFVQGGNAFGTTATLGTTDNQPLNVVVNGGRVMRYEQNATSPNLIGGYFNNGIYAGAVGTTIAGGGAAGSAYFDATCPYAFGCQNTATDHFGTIGGGLGNLVGDTDATLNNSQFGTVGGGWNNAAGDRSFVGGGSFNQSVATGSSVVGGGSNLASAFASHVGGGTNNQATAPGSAVLGGALNAATGYSSTVTGGIENVAGGPYSAVPGGTGNHAGGFASFAAGYHAHADFDSCFVWSDNSPGAGGTCTVAKQFWVQSYGGVVFSTGSGVAAFLDPGSGAWSNGSDRATKDNVELVDAEDVLRKVVAMPIATWNWKSQDVATRHMGPMAQDFSAAFGLGESDKAINTIDADGVALAAIQGLNAKLETGMRERDAALASARDEIAALREEVAAARSLSGDVAALKAALAEMRRGRESVAAR